MVPALVNSPNWYQPDRWELGVIENAVGNRARFRAGTSLDGFLFVNLASINEAKWDDGAVSAPR